MTDCVDSQPETQTAWRPQVGHTWFQTTKLAFGITAEGVKNLITER